MTSSKATDTSRDDVQTGTLHGEVPIDRPQAKVLWPRAGIKETARCFQPRRTVLIDREPRDGSCDLSLVRSE
jgi:hypothetical protein